MLLERFGTEPFKKGALEIGDGVVRLRGEYDEEAKLFAQSLANEIYL